MIDWSELGNWQEYTKFFIAVFVMVSPQIVIPLFVGVVGGRSTEEKKKTGFYGAVGFGITMWVFVFGGVAILDIFGITIAAFRIAGGFLLLLIGLDMLRADPTANVADKNVDASSSALMLGIVPVAIPILAGPGAISTVVIFSKLHDSFEHKILMAAVILSLVIYLAGLFRLIVVSDRVIGKNTTIIFNKVMGLILCAIAFEFILDGIAVHYPQISTIHGS